METPPLNRDGQLLNQRINQRRNREKAIFGLMGVLQGVIADSRFNEQELLFLDCWLKSQRTIADDGDVRDLIELMTDIFEDGIITSSALKELNLLIHDIVEYRRLEQAPVEDQINQLLGFLSGIAADSILNDTEIYSLRDWLKYNKETLEEWLGCMLARRIENILADGLISPEERADLLEIIKSISGQRFEETGIAHGMSTDFFGEDLDNFQHKGQCICFTGKFISGTRSTVETKAQQLGASVKNSISKDITAVVIGTLASRDWRFSSHGRKIEKAIKLRAEGVPLIIITEETWLKFI